MNEFVKAGLIFAVGAAAGGTAVYFITRKKMMEDMQDEIDEVREMYLDKINGGEGGKNVYDRDECIISCLQTLKDLDWDPDTDPSIEDLEDDGPNYVQTVNPVDDDENDEEEEEDDESPSESAEGIEELEKDVFYSDTYDDYNTVCITLYTDGVLTDDVEDDITQQKNDFFGDLDINSYELGDVIYFANHSAMLKIELTVSKQSYSRDVLGEEDEEPGNFAD